VIWITISESATKATIATSIPMILRHLLTSPAVFIIFGLLPVGEACWITNKRVQERDQAEPIHLLGAFLAALLVNVLLSVFFGFAAGLLIAEIVARSHQGQGNGLGWAFASMILGLAIGGLLGNITAFVITFRISPQFWPDRSSSEN
jgi:uncharacterized membrane protein